MEYHGLLQQILSGLAAVHDLFQVIDARTMPQLALTEQPTCEFLGSWPYLLAEELGALSHIFLVFGVVCGSPGEFGDVCVG